MGGAGASPRRPGGPSPAPARPPQGGRPLRRRYGHGKRPRSPALPSAPRHARHLPEPPRSAPGSDALRLSRNPLSPQGKGRAGPRVGCEGQGATPPSPGPPKRGVRGLKAQVWPFHEYANFHGHGVTVSLPWPYSKGCLKS